MAPGFGRPADSPRRARSVAASVRGRAPISIFVEALVLTIGGLFPIMNPFSTAPLYVSLTAGFDAKKRRRQAIMACVYAFGILATFLLLGSAIVEFFGISIPGIRAAGGLIISSVGFGMLFPPPPQTPTATETAASQSRDQALDVAFTPLAMPSLAGPGSISVVLSAAAQIRGDHPHNWEIIYVGVILGMAVTLVIAFIILRAAELMVRFLGKGGMDAMTRIFGFLLICIGMQFLLTGVGDFFGLSRG
ncbi:MULTISPECIES: MarC family NAAT transporter [unclassified Caulobacter]|uniref:MarC family NAAT transporter n=1 Tax=unclassified Caulobacter TaxID=2648921 RepID=UPI0009EC7671|nr:MULTISPECIES: MarC family NAAT transporter [unclassified Caulobacter]